MSGDAYVNKDDTVLAVDAFVDMEGVAVLGFDVELDTTGRNRMSETIARASAHRARRIILDYFPRRAESSRLRLDRFRLRRLIDQLGEGHQMTIKIIIAAFCALIVTGCAGTQTKFNPIDWKHDTANPHE